MYCKSGKVSSVWVLESGYMSIFRDVTERCKCGVKLHHHDCGLVSMLWKYKHGVHYSNGGQHSHPRPTHILHLLPNERARFDMIVAPNPKVGDPGPIVG